jgi:hypothetical protein
MIDAAIATLNQGRLFERDIFMEKVSDESGRGKTGSITVLQANLTVGRSTASNGVAVLQRPSADLWRSGKCASI